MRARRHWWPYAVLFAELLVFYRRVLFVPGGYVIPWDLRYYHFPIAAFMARSLSQGVLPLWDPYAYCGMPIYADPQTQLFYPPALAAIFASNWFAPGNLLYFLELQLIGHVLVAGVFTYWLLRRMDANPAAAATGATVFQLGAFFASQTQHLSAIDAAAWLPLALLAVLHLGEAFRLTWLAALAFSLAMSILAGFPAVTAVVLGGTLLLAILLVVFRQASPKLGLAWLGAGAWAALLAAILILPAIELTRHSVAQYRSDFMGTGAGMPLQSLVSLVLPNHYSVFDRSRYSLPWNFTFLYTYCGIAGLALAIAGALRRLRLARVFLLLTVIATLAMLGDSTPAGKAAWMALPRMVRAPLYPQCALVLFTLGVAVLAGLGAQKFGTGALARALLAVTAIDLIAVSSGRPMNTASLHEDPGISHEMIDGDTQAVGRMRALVDQSSPPWRIDTIDDTLTWASAPALFKIPDANGNDPFAPLRYMQVRLSIVSNGARWGRYYQVANPDSPLLDLLNVRYLLSRTPVAGTRLTRVAELPGRIVYENRNALPRFFLVNRTVRAAGMDEALAIMRSPAFRPKEMAVVQGAPSFTSDNGELPPVRVVRYEPREIALETSAAHAAFLVSSENAYPGWHADLDGREQPLVLTNVAFRGLPVPPGRHQIEMRFDPPILWHAAAVTAFALLALLWAAASAIIGKRPWTS